MNQQTFPMIIYAALAIACIAYLVRGVAPRVAGVVGWSSGIAASLTFMAMVVIDAFQPELPGILQNLAMPAPLERTKAYWAALLLHVTISLIGGIYCFHQLVTFRTGFAHTARGA